MVNGNGNHSKNHLVLDTENWNAGEKGSSIASTFQPHIAQDRLEDIIRALLIEIGVDVKSEHFCDTPARVARFYREFTAGRGAQPADILKTFPFASKDLVIVSHIDFFSLCPHHLLLYSGKLHFAYVPDELIVGLSKIPRLVHALSRRLVVQEALVSDIADAFMMVVKPLGCAVKAIGHHSCIAARGVRCPATRMIAIARRGIFETSETLRRDFDQAIAEGSKRHRATASQE